MNIQTVAQNLRNTIAGKEQALAVYKENLDGSLNTNLVSTVTTRAAIQFLEINIDELKRILQDVEQCRPEWNQFNCPYAEAETCHRID